MAALIVDNSSGMFIAGYAGSVPLQCPLRLSAGLCCQASWTVWIRMTVFFSLFVDPSSGWVAHVMFPSGVSWPEALGIMAVMDQKDSYVLFPGSGTCKACFADILHFAPCSSRGRQVCILAGGTGTWRVWFRLQNWIFHSCSSSLVVDFRRGAEADSHGLAVQQTIVIHQLQFMHKMIDGPEVRVVLGFPVSFTCPLCATTGAWLRFAVAVLQQGCPQKCRGPEFVPHGLADRRDSLVAVHRCSMTLF